MSQNKNYHMEDEEAVEKSYVCELCQYKATKESVIKKHITQKHKDRNIPITQNTVGGEDLEDDIEAEMRDLAQWDRPPATTEDRTEDRTDENDDDLTENVVVINDTTGEEGSLGQAIERIKVLEEDLSVKEELVKKMEAELETARDIANVAVAKEASLEDEKAKLKHHLDFFRRVTKTQKEDNDKMTGGAPNPEAERKLKEANNKIKSNNKHIESIEKSKNELIKKVEEEVSGRAKAEADCAKFSKMVDILQQCEERRKETTDKSKVKCRDVGRAGGCPRAGSCPYLHPALAKENKNIDCHHWMSGRCRYTENECRFKHDPAKKDSKSSKRKRSEDSVPDKDTSQQDFLLGLVKALAQGNGLGGQERSAQGLEGQTTTRPRMEAPASSARGQDGQQWGHQSYASATSTPGRVWGQEDVNYSRQEGAARGQDGLEGLRGLVQGHRSAQPVDRIQEGIQLLMQLAAQQAGRR